MEKDRKNGKEGQGKEVLVLQNNGLGKIHNPGRIYTPAICIDT